MKILAQTIGLESTPTKRNSIDRRSSIEGGMGERRASGISVGLGDRRLSSNNSENMRRTSSGFNATKKIGEIVDNHAQSHHSPGHGHGHAEQLTIPKDHENWVAATVKTKSKPATIGDVQQMWLRYDLNRNGTMGKREFFLFYVDYQKLCGLPATREDFESLYYDIHTDVLGGRLPQPADLSKDITWNQFCDFFSIFIPKDEPKAIYVEKEAAHLTTKLQQLGFGEKTIDPKSLVAAWKIFDVDHNGLLDRNEFKSFYVHYTSKVLNELPTEAGFTLFWDHTSSADDFVRWKEFVRALGLDSHDNQIMSEFDSVIV